MIADREKIASTPRAAGERQWGRHHGSQKPRRDLIRPRKDIHKLAKSIAFYGLKLIGIFALFRFLNRRSLKILCYHGFAVGSEYEFRPKLFMNPVDFANRMAWLKRKGYRVVPLSRAIDDFQRGIPQKNSI